MTTLETAFASVTRLALDSAPIIYFVETHPRYDALVTTIFQRIADGEIEGITSALTLTEVLALPIQQQRFDLCQTYKRLLTSAEHFTLVNLGVKLPNAPPRCAPNTICARRMRCKLQPLW